MEARRSKLPCTTQKINLWSSRRVPLLVAWLLLISYQRRYCCQALLKLWIDPRTMKLNSCQWRNEERSSEKLDLSGLESWTQENKEKALDLLTKFHDVFALEDGEMGCTEATEHHIEVTDPCPFKERPRNIPQRLLQEVKDHLDQMLDVGAIKLSNSTWSNAVVLIRKDRGLRFCIDFRCLNFHTKKDAFPLLRIHAAINALRGSKYYMTVDLLSGFLQTLMAEVSKQHTAFTVGMLGFYECKPMPFELCNAQ